MDFTAGTAAVANQAHPVAETDWRTTVSDAERNFSRQTLLASVRGLQLAQTRDTNIASLVELAHKAEAQCFARASSRQSYLNNIKEKVLQIMAQVEGQNRVPNGATASQNAYIGAAQQSINAIQGRVMNGMANYNQMEMARLQNQTMYPAGLTLQQAQFLAIQQAQKNATEAQHRGAIAGQTNPAIYYQQQVQPGFLLSLQQQQQSQAQLQKQILQQHLANIGVNNQSLQQYNALQQQQAINNQNQLAAHILMAQNAANQKHGHHAVPSNQNILLQQQLLLQKQQDIKKQQMLQSQIYQQKQAEQVQMRMALSQKNQMQQTIPKNVQSQLARNLQMANGQGTSPIAGRGQAVMPKMDQDAKEKALIDVSEEDRSKYKSETLKATYYLQEFAKSIALAPPTVRPRLVAKKDLMLMQLRRQREVLLGNDCRQTAMKLQELAMFSETAAKLTSKIKEIVARAATEAKTLEKSESASPLRENKEEIQKIEPIVIRPETLLQRHKIPMRLQKSHVKTEKIDEIMKTSSEASENDEVAPVFEYLNKFVESLERGNVEETRRLGHVLDLTFDSATITCPLLIDKLIESNAPISFGSAKIKSFADVERQEIEYLKQVYDESKEIDFI